MKSSAARMIRTLVFSVTCFISTTIQLNAQQCIDPPAINGSPAVGAAPTGWSLYSQTPDIILGNGLWPGGTFTVSNVSGLSSSGGEMGLFLANSLIREGWQTTLTNLTVGELYTVKLEWEKATLSDSTPLFSGGQLYLEVAGVSQTFSSVNSAGADSWQIAAITFTATSTTETLKAAATNSSFDDGISGGAIVVDSGGACAVVTGDTTAPTATISPADGATDVARDGTITITFDEAVKLLNGDALTAENIAALITLKDTDSSGADIPFTVTISGDVVTITPTSNFGSAQQVYVAIGASVEDEAGNPIVPTSATFTVGDYSQPSVVISGPTEPVDGAFLLTFTFSEDVTGFDINDITIFGGTLSEFSGSGGTYTVLVTPIVGALVRVSVSANSGQDATGNGNQASDIYTVQAGSPAAEFDRYIADIRRVIEGDAELSLRSTLGMN